jgi:hypothetical protein
MCANFIGVYLNPKSFKNLQKEMLINKKRQKHIRSALLNARAALRISGGMLFNPSSKQHLLITLLEDIKNDNSESLYNFRRSNEFWLRHLMTKELMKLMSETYNAKDLNPSLVVDVVSEMIKIFYKPMDRSDASKLARKILRDRIKDKEFRQKTVAELIGFRTRDKKNQKIISAWVEKV